MLIQLRNDKVIIDGYVNAVGRDSRPIRDKKTGECFIEQIVPGAFKRALGRREVKLLLNHDREIGSTETNLTLHEDAIGLRAHAEIEDAEIIEKARAKKLRGWSFGFYERYASEEEIKNNMKRRYVEELDLEEVSIIDERKVPCYEGTSIETRAEGNELIKTEVIETRAEYPEISEQKQNVPDYSKYEQKIKELEERK